MGSVREMSAPLSQNKGAVGRYRERHHNIHDMMSNPHLPAEMQDHVIDHLHDEPEALKRCCLVSKSWIPASRMHLFTSLKFYTPQDVQSWKRTFPDPAISPAYYAKTLYVGPQVVAAADPEVDGWIRGFPHVKHIAVGNQGLFPFQLSSLVPFQGFSPAITSLRLTFIVYPSPRIFDLILSFPLLEDLAVIAAQDLPFDDIDSSDEPSTVVQPSSSPVFTGSLELYLKAGMERFTHRLLSLPGGIHFRKLTLTWSHEGDLVPITALVEECSGTLESLTITCNIVGTSIRHLLPYRWLTSVSRCVAASSDRPHASAKTQRRNVSTQFVWRRMDHYGPQNYHTQPSSSSTNHYSCPLLCDHRWFHHETYRRTSPRAVART
jgi:hypothetical protein